MQQPEKIESVKKLKTLIEENQNIFLIQFSKVSVPSITRLRQKVREKNARYIVAKNTLILRAVEGTELEVLKSHLQGPTALVVHAGDPVEVAKVLADFNKDNPAFTFKGGYVEKRAATGDQLKSLATMPSKPELIAKVLYLMKSPIQRLVYVLSAPPQQLVGTLSAISGKK
jgi:large subunit ribosomal protein L10